MGVPVTEIVVGARSYYREYRSLATLIERLKPDLVHTHGYRADVIGSLAARRRKVATVSTVHGFTGGDVRNWINERLQCLALQRADAVIAVSRPLVARLTAAGIPRDKIHFVQNGYMPSAHLDRAAARKRLGIVWDGPLIGWIGRLSREKGADIMLDALALSDSSWRLSVIGDGAERDSLQRQMERRGLTDRVTFYGEVADAASLLSAFDVFVLSSRTEGTPITLLEAMDAQVPIIATSVGGVPDVVTSDTAILVAPGQPAAIAGGLRAIRNDAAAAAQRSARARERLVAEFAASRWLDSVARVYSATLSRTAQS
jgi:glycosyltransferase involved in cell wall biosynthesis